MGKKKQDIEFVMYDKAFWMMHRNFSCKGKARRLTPAQHKKISDALTQDIAMLMGVQAKLDEHKDKLFFNGDKNLCVRKDANATAADGKNPIDEILMKFSKFKNGYRSTQSEDTSMLVEYKIVERDE
ncbi:MAG: hypothetical protein JSS82_07385 [Bacteroidetes bacterium]|nr:hypothetical protein [Bacteroidota bacterium]